LAVGSFGTIMMTNADGEMARRRLSHTMILALTIPLALLS
jgi:hypothetical protein